MRRRPRFPPAKGNCGFLPQPAVAGRHAFSGMTAVSGGIRAAEEYADDSGRRLELLTALEAVQQVFLETCEPYEYARYQPAVAAVRWLLAWQRHHSDYGDCPPEAGVAGNAAYAFGIDASRRTGDQGTAENQESRHQCDPLRDIVGNPYRPGPVLDPAWFAWQGRVVAQLARAAYENRHLPEGNLDPARLEVLADALEDAGCATGTARAPAGAGGPM